MEKLLVENKSLERVCIDSKWLMRFVKVNNVKTEHIASGSVLVYLWANAEKRPRGSVICTAHSKSYIKN